MWLFTRGYPIQLELHFWCRKSLRFLRVNHDRQRAIGTQLNVKLWKYHGKSMENMDHMFINMFINSILYVKFMENPWNIHGTSMEHPWNIHGTSGISRRFPCPTASWPRRPQQPPAMAWGPWTSQRWWPRVGGTSNDSPKCYILPLV